MTNNLTKQDQEMLEEFRELFCTKMKSKYSVKVDDYKDRVFNQAPEMIESFLLKHTDRAREDFIVELNKQIDEQIRYVTNEGREHNLLESGLEMAKDRITNLTKGSDSQEEEK